MFRSTYAYAKVALFAVGSAALLFSCEGTKREAATPFDETIMTQYSEHLTIVESENGQKSYQFTTPLLEGYSLAKDPYREFRKGVDIVTYKKDSLASVDATLSANYAISYTKRDLWEAKGNVVIINSEGRELYTQQLFWNAKTKRIYSNVDSKLVTNDGRYVYYGEGFESDDALKDWRFRRMTGRMEVEVKPDSDSLSGDGSRPAPPAVPKSSTTSVSDPPHTTAAPKVSVSALHPHRDDAPSDDNGTSQKSDGRLRPLSIKNRRSVVKPSQISAGQGDEVLRHSVQDTERQKQQMQ